MNLGLYHPQRIESFIACDTSSKSPAGNSKAWGDRIAVAERENTKDNTVGEQLAEMTVRRWFVKESFDGAIIEARIAKVKRMIQTNSLDGFVKSVQALYEYDMKQDMKKFAGKGAFFVGSGDGALPDTMKDMAASLGNGARFEIIQNAGHLPMVEKPEDFTKAVSSFLGTAVL